jgi:hypothetical protein
MQQRPFKRLTVGMTGRATGTRRKHEKFASHALVDPVVRRLLMVLEPVSLYRSSGQETHRFLGASVLLMLSEPHDLHRRCAFCLRAKTRTRVSLDVE